MKQWNHCFNENNPVYQNDRRDYFLFLQQYSTLFAIFAIDFRKVVRHKRTKSVIETRLVIKFSQNLNMERGRVATTLTLRIYTILKGRTIYSHGVSGCCLSTP